MTEEMEIEPEAPSLVEEAMANTDGTKSVDQKKDEEEEEDSSDEEKEDVTTKVRKALFAAVEGGGNGGNEDDEDVLSFQPLMRLFVPSKTSRSIRPSANARQLKELIFKTIKGFHKGYARRFFAGLKPMVERVKEEETYCAEATINDDETLNSTIAAEDIQPDANSSKALKFLLTTTQILQAYLDAALDKKSASSRKSLAGKSASIVSEAFEVAEVLHGMLLDIHSFGGPDGVPVCAALSSLCEKWWLANGTQRELIISNALFLLVLKATGVEGKPAQKSDIKRLLKIEDAFHHFDYSDDASDDLRKLLLKVSSSPLCLKLPEGKRFISALFLLDPSFVSDLHQAIRIQIPQSKKPILRTYGEIYKKAWMDSHNNSNSECPEEIQAAIEEDVLQDLMYSALHIAKPRMAKILLLILEPFHESKKNQDFEGLLHRMYGPILWRALTAANPQVRINAAHVLGEVFPLQEPSAAQVGAAYKRGAAAIKALLKDKNPSVRAAGSETATKVLGTYWDVLSTDDIRTLLNYIVTKHASDATSYTVRVGAIKAISALLDNRQCHAVLRALLPSLGNLVHDKHKSVRLAAVNMLLKVKAMKEIKYYHVVPVDHLKARLADEGRLSSLGSQVYNPQLYMSPVASGLTRLMLNSFVPQGPDVTANQQIQRMLSLLHTDPDAAVVFYANVADHLPPMAIAKLATMLFRALGAAIVAEQTDTSQSINDSSDSNSQNDSANESSASAECSHEQSKSANESSISNESNKEQRTNVKNLLTASNTPYMALLAEVMATLWESIWEDFECEGSCKNALIQCFSGNRLSQILGYFEQQAIANGGKNEKTQDYSRIIAALLRCGGCLEPKYAEDVVKHISTLLQKLSANSTKAWQHRQALLESMPNHFALLCLWGMSEDVATSLSASIIAGFDEGDDSTLISPQPSNSNSRKRKSLRDSRRKPSVENSMVPLLPPAVAIEVLNEILVGSDPGNIAARESLLASVDAREKLEEAFEVATQYTGRFLKSAAVQDQTVNDLHFHLMLQVCETFGRFAVHKAGFMSIEEDTSMGLNLEAKHLLEWTTEQVLPALMLEGKGIPLQELDLSRISFVNDSMVSMELNETLEVDPPALSLTPVAPPRKRGNRQATPRKLDGSFGPAPAKRNDSRINPGDSTAMMIRCASSSLLSQSCLIMSEFLQVGGGSGAEKIAEAAVKWCCILDVASKSKNDDEANVEIGDKENKDGKDDKLKSFQIDLLPYFARLSAVLGITASNFQLLKVFLRKLPRLLDEVEEVEGASERIEVMIQDIVTSLLKATSSREATVAAVLELVYDNLQSLAEETETSKGNAGSKNDEGDSFEFPILTMDLVSGEDFSSLAVVVSGALHSCVMHKQGGLLLAENIWRNLDANIRAATEATEEEKKGSAANTLTTVLFEAKCLWYLWDSGSCRKATDFKGILRKVENMDCSNEDFFGQGKPVGLLLKAMMETATMAKPAVVDAAETE